MVPPARQLWEKQRHTASVGVSADDPGLIYRNISQGVPRNGMPAYAHRYSSQQMWDIALLLKNADQPLPEPVLRLLTTEVRVP